ncbi:MAG: hypothetical protein WBW16_04575 [Bacteroidota bacterium]
MTKSLLKMTLALGRALILQPKAFLLDEPSLSFSPKLVTKAFEAIKEVNQKFRTTILTVEQKVHEILKIARRVYTLRMGEVVFSGPPEENELSRLISYVGYDWC